MIAVGLEVRRGVYTDTLSVVSTSPTCCLPMLIRQLFVPADRTSWTSRENSQTSSSPFSDQAVSQSGILAHPNHVHTTLQPLQSPLEVCKCYISFYYPPIRLQQNTT